MVKGCRIRSLLARLVAVGVLFAQATTVVFAYHQAVGIGIFDSGHCAVRSVEAGTSDPQIPLGAPEGNLCEVHCQSVTLPEATISLIGAVAAVGALPVPPPCNESLPNSSAASEPRGGAVPLRKLYSRLLI